LFFSIKDFFMFKSARFGVGSFFRRYLRFSCLSNLQPQRISQEGYRWTSSSSPLNSKSTQNSKRQQTDEENRGTAKKLAIFGLALLGIAYASVPLYRLFCTTTGFGFNFIFLQFENFEIIHKVEHQSKTKSINE
jgi:hypothetical protein